MTFTFELPFVSPSLNQIIEWKRRATWRYSKLKEDAAVLMRLDLRRAGFRCEERPTQRMRVDFTRISPRRLDDDNLAGGFKPIRDALKKINVIRDDNPKWLEAGYHWEKGAGSIRIEVRPA